VGGGVSCGPLSVNRRWGRVTAAGCVAWTQPPGRQSLWLVSFNSKKRVWVSCVCGFAHKESYIHIHFA
jgi:hypothetical protein